MKAVKKSAVQKRPVKDRLHRFIGVSFAGGKTDKTCIAVIEYYPQHKKIFLTKLIEKIKSESEFSSDFKVYQFLQQYHEHIEFIGFDVPMTLPPCIDCKLTCPGYESCSVDEVEWMRAANERMMKRKKPKKNFTPYTQRAVEFQLMESLEEKMQIHHALGANLAPLTARAHFLKKRLKASQIVEVFPRLSLWRIGNSLKVNKSHLRFHKHAVGGNESRLALLRAMSDQLNLFIYDQDLRSMTENNHAFEALIVALTALLKFTGQTEPRPKGFPAKAQWIEFPVPEPKWRT